MQRRALTATLVSVVLLFTSGGCGGSLRTENVLSNGSFETWSNGPRAEPDGWALAAGVGAVERAEAVKRTGEFSVKLVRTDGNVNMFQRVPEGVNAAGRAVVCSVWAHTREPRAVRLDVGDDAGMAYSRWHSGSGQWGQLRATYPVPARTSGLRVVLDVSHSSPGSAPRVYVAHFDDVECHLVAKPIVTTVDEFLARHALYDIFPKIGLVLTVLGTVILWRFVRAGDRMDRSPNA